MKKLALLGILLSLGTQAFGAGKDFAKRCADFPKGFTDDYKIPVEFEAWENQRAYRRVVMGTELKWIETASKWDDPIFARTLFRWTSTFFKNILVSGNSNLIRRCFEINPMLLNTTIPGSIYRPAALLVSLRKYDLARVVASKFTKEDGIEGMIALRLYREAFYRYSEGANSPIVLMATSKLIKSLVGPHVDVDSSLP